MTDDDAQIFERYADIELVFEYLLVRIRIEAAKASALLLSAANDHLRMYATSPPVEAVLDAAQALAVVAADGLRVESEPPAGGERAA